MYYRKLALLTTNLVVIDQSWTNKIICLAVLPALKLTRILHEKREKAW